MFGKPEWFGRRKYGGWGIVPKTWQGWVYICVAVAVFIVLQSLPFWTENVRMGIAIGWAVLLSFDVIHVMVRINGDEREYKIEAISERNASWSMVAVLTMGIAFQAARSAVTGKQEMDWFLLAALFAGVIAKAISNVVYSKRPL